VTAPADSSRLPSSPVQPPDPLDVTSGLQLRADLDDPLRFGFVGYDDSGGVVLRGKRDGQGLRALMMNFVIQNAQGQPYYRIRQPSSGIHLDPPFQLQAPDGSLVGLLRFAMNRASLELPGQLPVTAAMSALAWHGSAVEQGSVTLATITFVGHPFGPPGAELHLHFEPLGSALPVRRRVVALVAWAALFSPPWRKMTTV
jgi:hypothetical protein